MLAKRMRVMGLPCPSPQQCSQSTLPKGSKDAGHGAGRRGAKPPALNQSHTCIFSTAVKSRAHLWIDSRSLGKAGLLNMKQHILQPVVAGERHPIGQQLWPLKLLALKVAEGSLAGGTGVEGEQLSHTHDATEASRSQAPTQKCCLHTCSLLCLKPLQ